MGVDLRNVILVWVLLVVGASMGCSGGGAETELIKSAKQLIEKRQFPAAAIQLKTALQKNGSSKEARFLLGTVLFDTGEMVAAETELTKARTLGYPDEDVIPVLAQVMLELGQVQKLIAEYGSLEFKNPASAADLGTSVAMAYARTGQKAKAQARLETALKLQPDFAPAILLQARILASSAGVEAAMNRLDAASPALQRSADAAFLEGSLKLNGKNDIPGAIQSFERSLTIDPAYVPAHASLISLYLYQKDRDAAKRQVAALKKALPDTIVVKLYTAQMAYLDGDYKQSRTLSQQLLRVAPNNLRALYIGGASEMNLNSPLQAAAMFNKALAIAPDQSDTRQLLVKTYLQSGQAPLALKALAPALAAKSPDLETLLLAGQAYLQNGDAKNSEIYFKRARELKPDDNGARTALAVVSLAKGQDELGFKELEAISKTDTGIAADMALISSHLKRGQFDGALAAVATLEAKQPTLPLAAFLRGRILTLRSDFPGAQKSFEAALALDAKYFPAVNGIVLLEVAAGHPDAAQKRLDAFISANPGHMQALMTLADLRVTNGASKDEVTKLMDKAIRASPGEADPHLMLVEYLLLQNDSKTALIAAQAAVAAVPNSLELMDAQGRAHLASGDSMQAISAFGKLAQLQPTTALPHLRTAQAYVQTKDREAAIRSLQQALTIQPDYLLAQQMLLSLELQAGRHQRAIDVARSIQKQRPDQALGYMLEGETEADRKRWDAAVTAYKAGLEKNAPGALPSKLHLALLAAKRNAEAVQLALTWQKSHPKDAAFRQYLGDIALAQKDFPAAERLYRDIIQINPNNAIVMNNIAWLMVAQKEAGALEMAKKALTMASNSPAALDTMSFALAEEKQFAKAIEFSKQAADIAVDAPRYRLNLARLLIKAGDKTQAKTELTRLAVLGEKFANQDEVASLLRDL